ncbi:MAG: hypothetical protein RL664_1865, partial [Bacteroidota bacterium]
AERNFLVGVCCSSFFYSNGIAFGIVAVNVRKVRECAVVVTEFGNFIGSPSVLIQCEVGILRNGCIVGQSHARD